MRFSYISLISRRWQRRRASCGSYTAFLDFSGKYQILPISVIMRWSWRRSIIRSVPVTEDKKRETDTGIVLKGYVLTGRFSYASNKKLANNRVKALRLYPPEECDFKADFFTMSSEPEDWVGFKEKVKPIRM